MMSVSHTAVHLQHFDGLPLHGFWSKPFLSLSSDGSWTVMLYAPITLPITGTGIDHSGPQALNYNLPGGDCRCILSLDRTRISWNRETDALSQFKLRSQFLSFPHVASTQVHHIFNGHKRSISCRDRHFCFFSLTTWLHNLYPWLSLKGLWSGQTS